METERRLIAVIANVLEVEPESITLDTTSDQVEAWDSLGHVNVVSEVESAFGITIPIEEVAEIGSVRDFLGYMESS